MGKQGRKSRTDNALLHESLEKLYYLSLKVMSHIVILTITFFSGGTLFYSYDLKMDLTWKRSSKAMFSNILPMQWDTPISGEGTKILITFPRFNLPSFNYCTGRDMKIKRFCKLL